MLESPWLLLLRSLYMELDLHLIMKQATLINSGALYYLQHHSTEIPHRNSFVQPHWCAMESTLTSYTCIGLICMKVLLN